ncbi:MAG TPA: ribonuclease PH [Pyrinomonadaceae bacterium]|nr:ribonuclease PH [Pyrinomonadaceae bacterium]
MSFARTDGRAADEIRTAVIEPGFLPYAEGSALITMGSTRVICAASLEETVPRWVRNTGQGWLTAEYSMLPRATQTRTQREITRGKLQGRSQEIQRLIGRSLRAVADLRALAERTIYIDCDVLHADGGTRTAAITGAYVAFALASKKLLKAGKITRPLVNNQVAAISVGIVDNVPLLDLKYDEDSRAQVDMNIVCTSEGRFIELQGTAEKGEPFSRDQMDELLALGKRGIDELLEKQKCVISQAE